MDYDKKYERTARNQTHYFSKWKYAFSHSINYFDLLVRVGIQPTRNIAELPYIQTSFILK